MDGLCDKNQPEFAYYKACHAGGNPCWERVVDVESVATVEAAPPQAIEQVLDDLEVRWRLAFGRAVVDLPERGGQLPGAAMQHAGRVERRLSSLAEIIKLLDISHELLPSTEKMPDKSHTLVRLGVMFEARLAEEDRAGVAQAIATLRSIDRLRIGGQHSGAKAERVQAADMLGIALDGRWSESWDRARALTARALRDLGNGARRIADTSD